MDRGQQSLLGQQTIRDQRDRHAYEQAEDIADEYDWAGDI